MSLYHLSEHSELWYSGIYKWRSKIVKINMSASYDFTL